MASRTGLMPAKVKKEVKTKLTSLAARRSLQAPKTQLNKLAAVSDVKGKRESARPVLPFRRDLPGKKSSVASKFVKNVAPAGGKDKPVLTGRLNVNMRKSLPGFIAKERTLPKHTTPSRRSLAVGRPTPKSILKREVDIPDTEKMCAKVADSTDSRHVKFKSKALEQAAMRAKLDAWLEAKGRTSSMSKFRHSSCFNTETASSASSKRVALVDRTITQNLLSQQMKVLNNETVKKKLFPGSQLSAKDGKENTQQTLKLSANDDALDTNDNATNSTGPEEVADTITEPESRSPYKIPNNVQCETQTNDVLSVKVLNKIEAMLEESLHLLDAGCPLESVLQWFTEMESSMPETLTLATYHIHKAHVVAAFPQMVLQVFCEAVRHNAQPSELIAVEMKNMFSKWLTSDNSKAKAVGEQLTSIQDVHGRQAPPGLDAVPPTQAAASSHTPKQVRGQRRSSVSRAGSTVKYSIGSTNRHFIRTPSKSTIAVVTPVRRSTRLSGKPPLSSARLRREVNSISDISSAERKLMLFQVNPALTGN